MLAIRTIAVDESVKYPLYLSTFGDQGLESLVEVNARYTEKTMEMETLFSQCIRPIAVDASVEYPLYLSTLGDQGLMRVQNTHFTFLLYTFPEMKLHVGRFLFPFPATQIDLTLCNCVSDYSIYELTEKFNSNSGYVNRNRIVFIIL